MRLFKKVVMGKEQRDKSIRFWSERYRQNISAEEAYRIEENLCAFIAHMLKTIEHKHAETENDV